MHLPSQLAGKFGSKAIPTVFVGYDTQTKGYRCFDPVSRRILISPNVTFIETRLGDLTPPTGQSDLFLDLLPHLGLPSLPAEGDSMEEDLARPGRIHTHTDLGTNLEEGSTLNQSDPSSDFETGGTPTSEPHISNTNISTPVPQGSTPLFQRRGIQARRLPARYRTGEFEMYIPDDVDLCLVETSNPVSDDLTFAEAIADPLWHHAMKEELHSLKNKTWELTELPPGRRAVSSKWIFKTKPICDPSDPTRTRLKARLVARGLEQQHGIDYNDTFAPVVRWSTLRTIIAIAVAAGWPISHMDVVTAFLNGNLQEVLYMQQPQGFEEEGSENLVCRLLKSIYGLKQSPRAWYQEIDKHLRAQGWTRSNADPNLYFLQEGASIVLLLLYVDDLLITGNDSTKVVEEKKKLQEKYEMKDLGEIRKYLGVEFAHTPSGLLLHQRSYAEQILQECDMVHCKPAHTPLPEGFVTKSDTGTAPVDLSEYCKIVGKLLFLTTTRPDLSYSVGIAARFMSKPQQQHLDAVKHILRYIKTTTDFGISFQRSPTLALEGFTDADYLGCLDTRRSTAGYVFKLATGPISWASKRQPTVSDSTTEAEYKALCEATKEAVYLRRLLLELGSLRALTVPLGCKNSTIHSDLSEAHIPTIHDVHLNCDNQGSIRLAQNPIFHARTKHIEAKHHFVRERILEGEVSLEYVTTTEQHADIFTKQVCRQTFEKHREFLGLRSLSSVS